MSRPRTSIVILTRNQLACTRACVDSIRRHTAEPYELVFVDNGSTDGTLEYLRTLEATIVIDNGENLGFGAGCNQGIARAVGERVLLLNNDVVVTAGWLDALHAALDAREDWGIAGPRSNRVAGVQQVDDVDYDVETLEGLDAWAARWCSSHAQERTQATRLVGFCMLVERMVIDRIGGFDLRYGLGNFEDDDFCLRSAVAGWRGVIAQDSWVHHVGSRTFAGERIDYRATMGENLQRFAAAWELAAGEVTAEGYHADRLVDRTAFDERRHYAPLVARPDGGERVELGAARGQVLALCCDRLDPDATREALRAALGAFRPGDDVTVAVRIDPRDTGSLALLEQVADEIGDDELPDVALVAASDLNDAPLLRVAHLVLAPGRTGPAIEALARRHGVAAWRP